MWVFWFIFYLLYALMLPLLKNQNTIINSSSGSVSVGELSVVLGSSHGWESLEYTETCFLEGKGSIFTTMAMTVLSGELNE